MAARTQGDALVYLTVDRDGQPAHPAVHASCPVLSSEEKLVLRQWVSVAICLALATGADIAVCPGQIGVACNSLDQSGVWAV